MTIASMLNVNPSTWNRKQSGLLPPPPPSSFSFRRKTLNNLFKSSSKFCCSSRQVTTAIEHPNNNIHRTAVGPLKMEQCSLEGVCNAGKTMKRRAVGITVVLALLLMKAACYSSYPAWASCLQTEHCSATSLPADYRRESEWCGELEIIVFSILALCIFKVVSDLGGPNSVIELQVGFFGPVPSLQQDLDEAYTFNSNRIVLYMAARALYPHSNNSFSGYVSVKWVEYAMFARKVCNEIFDRRTLTKKRSKNLSCDEYTVVTIIIAVDEEQQLPKIKSCGDLQSVLLKLKAIGADQGHVSMNIAFALRYENVTKQELELYYPELSKAKYFDVPY
ncbi:uncharacterized protein LOC126686143 [Mercurialis annua]|uniref:uncharacterized protein LOC126686143 n=1 Tax=Mercurialis annua TaxID=3986 RepID=UPI0024ACD731|nr:uncharacterized protein LOC126686143 [Mercurialis annua]